MPRNFRGQHCGAARASRALTRVLTHGRPLVTVLPGAGADFQSLFAGVEQGRGALVENASKRLDLVVLLLPRTVRVTRGGRYSKWWSDHPKPPQTFVSPPRTPASTLALQTDRDIWSLSSCSCVALDFQLKMGLRKVSKARSSFVWKQCSAQLPSTFPPPMASERRFLRRYIMWEAKRRGH